MNIKIQKFLFLTLKSLKVFTLVLFISLFFGNTAFGENKDGDPPDTTGATGDVAVVICNIVKYVRQLGLPIMTLIILGSSLMAIFGKLGWPAIVVLVVFTAVFFGSAKLIKVFAPSSVASNFDC